MPKNRLIQLLQFSTDKCSVISYEDAYVNFVEIIEQEVGEILGAREETIVSVVWKI